MKHHSLKKLLRGAAVLAMAAAVLPKLPALKADAASYNLFICGTRVSDANKADILGNGVFSYNSSLKVLTVQGNCSAGGSPCIESSIVGLTIKVEEDSVFEETSYWEYYPAIYIKKGSCTITGNGKLTLNCLWDDGIEILSGTLTIKDTNLDIDTCLIDDYMGGAAMYGRDGAKLIIDNSTVNALGCYTSGAIVNFGQGIELKSCAFTEPEEAFIGTNICSPNYSVEQPDDGNGNWECDYMPSTLVAICPMIGSSDVTLSKTSLPYTGSAVKVGSYLTVRHNGKKLVYGTDFTTTYANCVKAGYQTAYVTVTGVGSYTGTVTKYYTITPAQQAAPVLTPVAGGFQAAWTKDKNAVGYQLQYCKNSSFTGDTLHSAVYTGTSAALTKYPADGETWYVRVRAFVSSDGTTAGTKYGVWSDAASCTVPLTLTDADVKLSKTVLPYTGSAVKVGSYLTVKYNGKKLQYGTDFTTTYKNCVKAGYQTASVTVTGVGKYTGTVTKYYTIAPAQQAAPQLSFDDKGLHVQWTADSKAVGYQVMYCQDESFASSDPSCHVAVYGAGKTSCDLTKYPKYGETWFVRVRAFVSSDGTTAGTRSGIWSETAAIRAIDTLEITKLPGTDFFYEHEYDSYWYDFAYGEYEVVEYYWGGQDDFGDIHWGTPVKIGNYIRVKSGGKRLQYGKDFTVSYQNNVLYDGEYTKFATVTVRGTGECYGTVSKQFLLDALP